MNTFEMNINLKNDAAVALFDTIENVLQSDIEKFGYMRKWHRPIFWQCGECSISSEMALSEEYRDFGNLFLCKLDILSDTSDILTSVQFYATKDGQLVDSCVGFIIYNHLIEAVNTAKEFQDFERYRALVGFLISLAADKAIFKKWHRERG